MTETETGAETTTITTAEDLLADMAADLAMTTAVVVEAMTTGAEMTMGPLGEDPVVAHLPNTIPTMINMDLPADEAGIRMVHPAEGEAHRQTFVVELAAIATVGTRAFREYRSWFETLALASPTKILVRHLDASVTFEMSISPEITTHSKRKDLLSSNMPIRNVSRDVLILVSQGSHATLSLDQFPYILLPFFFVFPSVSLSQRLVKPRPKWTASTSRDLCLK